MLHGYINSLINQLVFFYYCNFVLSFPGTYLHFVCNFFFLNYYLLYCTLQFNCYESSLEIDVIFQNIIARIWTEKRQEDTQSKNEMIKETLFLEEYWMRPYHVSATC